MAEEERKVLDFSSVGKKATPEPGEGVPEDNRALSPVEVAVRQIAEYEGRVNEIVELFDSMEVKDEATAKEMTQLIARAKKFKKAIEEVRTGAVKPLNEEVKRVNTKAKLFTEPLEKAWKRGESKLSTYYYNLEMERRKAEEKARKEKERRQKELDKEAKKAGVEPVVLDEPTAPARETTTRTEGGTGYLKTVWTFEVEDEAKVPREYLSVDEKKIRAAVNAGVRKIKGVRIFEQPKAVVRT